MLELLLNILSISKLYVLTSLSEQIDIQDVIKIKLVHVISKMKFKTIFNDKAHGHP